MQTNIFIKKYKLHNAFVAPPPWYEPIHNLAGSGGKGFCVVWQGVVVLYIYKAIGKYAHIFYLCAGGGLNILLGCDKFNYLWTSCETVHFVPLSLFRGCVGIVMEFELR